MRGELADGFIPSDVSFRALTKKYKDKAIIKIDKSKLTSKAVGEKAKLISDLKQNKISIESLGVKILAKEMKIKDTAKLNDLFTALSQGDIDIAENLL